MDTTWSVSDIFLVFNILNVFIEFLFIKINCVNHERAFHAVAMIFYCDSGKMETVLFIRQTVINIQ